MKNGDQVRIVGPNTSGDLQAARADRIGTIFVATIWTPDGLLHDVQWTDEHGWRITERFHSTMLVPLDLPESHEPLDVERWLAQ